MVIHFIHQIHQHARDAPHHLLSPRRQARCRRPRVSLFSIIGVVWRSMVLICARSPRSTTPPSANRVRSPARTADKSECDAVCQPSLLEPNDYRV